MSDLYVFNPDHEMSVGQRGKHYTLPASIARMVTELAYLPAYIALPGSYVVMEDKPDEAFWEERLRIFGLEKRVVTWEEARRRAWNALKPWGWSPRIYAAFREIIPQCGEEFRQSPISSWREERRELYSRKHTIALLEELRGVAAVRIMGRGENAGGAMEGASIWETPPVVVTSMDELAVRVLQQRVVVKTPWSSSGKGVLMPERGELKTTERQWIAGALKKQGYLMVEPYLEKVMDFALEYEIVSPGNIRYLGISIFETTERGQYLGNIVASQAALRQKLLCFLSEELLCRLETILGELLLQHYGEDYRGPVGVDMMIYRNGKCLELHPCVEVNLRYNMGIVNIALADRYFSPGSEGRFFVEFHPRSGCTFQKYQEYLSRFPLVMEEGKIVSGFVHLTPVKQETGFIAYLLVAAGEI